MGFYLWWFSFSSSFPESPGSSNLCRLIWIIFRESLRYWFVGCANGFSMAEKGKKKMGPPRNSLGSFIDEKRRSCWSVDYKDSGQPHGIGSISKSGGGGKVKEKGEDAPCGRRERLPPLFLLLVYFHTLYVVKWNSRDVQPRPLIRRTGRERKERAMKTNFNLQCNYPLKWI